MGVGSWSTVFVDIGGDMPGHESVVCAVPPGVVVGVSEADVPWVRWRNAFLQYAHPGCLLRLPLAQHDTARCRPSPGVVSDRSAIRSTARPEALGPGGFRDRPRSPRCRAWQGADPAQRFVPHCATRRRSSDARRMTGDACRWWGVRIRVPNLRSRVPRGARSCYAWS